jgi:hypothetical protein
MTARLIGLAMATLHPASATPVEVQAELVRRQAIPGFPGIPGNLFQAIHVPGNLLTCWIRRLIMRLFYGINLIFPIESYPEY